MTYVIRFLYVTNVQIDVINMYLINIMYVQAADETLVVKLYHFIRNFEKRFSILYSCALINVTIITIIFSFFDSEKQEDC